MFNSEGGAMPPTFHELTNNLYVFFQKEMKYKMKLALKNFKNIKIYKTEKCIYIRQILNLSRRSLIINFMILSVFKDVVSC